MFDIFREVKSPSVTKLYMLPDSSREDSNNATTQLDLVRNYISKERQVTTENNKSNAEFSVRWHGTEDTRLARRIHCTEYIVPQKSKYDFIMTMCCQYTHSTKSHCNSLFS